MVKLERYYNAIGRVNPDLEKLWSTRQSGPSLKTTRLAVYRDPWCGILTLAVRTMI